MPKYRITGTATTNSSANTEDTLVEFTLATNSCVWITSVKVYPDDPASASSQMRGRMVTQSAAGATGTSGTAVKVNPNTRAAGSTVTVKNGATAFSVGSVSATHKRFTFNQYGFIEWEASESDPPVYQEAAGSATYASLLIQSSGTSQDVWYEVCWEE